MWLLQVYVAGASIPYPVNFVVNFLVILLFAAIVLAIACYRFYKSQATRAGRRLLTGAACLSLNMDGVKGRYPPAKVERLIKLNELRQQREAEAAEREYLIAASADRDQRQASTEEMDADVRVAPPLPPEKPPSSGGGAAQERAKEPPTTLPPVEPVVPTFMLQSVELDATEADLAAQGSVEFASGVRPATELSVGQSQNNRQTEDGGATPTLPGVVSSATKSSTGTQTSPREPADEEQRSDSSLEGSFDDSVMSF